MTYKVKDNYHKLKIRLKTNSNSPTSYYLNTYVNGSTSIAHSYVAQTDTENEDTVYFLIPLSDYTINDELSFMVDKTGTINLCDLNDGLTWLVDGEVVEQTHSNSHTQKYDSDGEHTIQAVFGGTTGLKMCYTPVETFKVTSPEYVPPSSDTPSTLTGKYKLEFVGFPKQLSYNDGQEIRLRLTRGGNPVRNKTVEKVTPQNIFSDDTNKYGEVVWTNTGFKAGKYTIGGYFYDYDTTTSGKRIQCYKTVTIKKHDLTVTPKTGNINRLGYIEVTYTNSKGKPVSGLKITTYVNGRKGSYTTDKNGKIKIKRYKKCTENWKFVFNGNTNYNKKTIKFKRKIL